MTRVELAGVLIGAMLLALGSISTLTATLRLKRGSVTLLTFGLWCGLYGARLLASQPAVRATIGGSPHQWARLVSFITYTINIPITIFVASLMGFGWRSSIRWLIAAVTGFGIVAVAADLISGTAGSANRVNNWVVLATIAIGLLNIIHSSVVRRARTPLTDPIVMLGGFILMLFVINENLGEIVSPRLNIEAIGVFIFIVCLGYAVGRSVLHAEAELASVQRELETARQIQYSLLPPQVPKPPGLDLAVRYVPAAAVAGDIYDFVQIGPSSVGVLVADVMGHGIPAALVASMVKLAFSMQAEHARDPAAVLTSMNQLLCRHLNRSYVTAVYAVLDAERGNVTIANAGHPPPFFKRQDDAITHVENEHGLMLGLFADAIYTNARVERMNVGDRFLLYSDGVVEARNRRGEFFDAERASRWISARGRAGADQVADVALDELTRWSDGGKFDDDVTFVVAEVVAQ
jgi:sigma-B regulation protein RsbU (phosphoserine phosphatase)